MANFKKLEDLNLVIKGLNEIDLTLNDKGRTMEQFESSEFAEILVGLGTGAMTLGGAYLAISTMGIVAGTSAAGITSGLAAIGGTMMGGIMGIAAAPLALGGLAYYGVKKYKEGAELKKGLKDVYIKSKDRKEKLILEIENGELKTKEREETLKNLLSFLNRCIIHLEDDLKEYNIL